MNKTNWADKLQRHPISVLSITFGLVLFITEGVKKIRFAQQLIEEITNAGINKSGNWPDVHLKLWYANALFFLVVLLVYSILLFTGTFLKLKNLRRNELSRTEVVRKTLDGMMAASLRIRNQLVAETEQPSLQLCLVEITYTARSNCEVSVVKRYHLRAIAAPVHFWEFFITVDDMACEAEFLDSLDFHVTEENGFDVVYLPMKNQSRSKSVAIYFLPEIKPDEPKARAIKVAYTWPGLANALKSKRRDNWTWHLKSHSPVPKVKVSFFYEDMGGEIEARIAGDTRGIQRLEHAEKNDQGLQAWHYAAENAPSGQYMLELRLR